MLAFPSGGTCTTIEPLFTAKLSGNDTKNDQHIARINLARNAFNAAVSPTFHYAYNNFIPAHHHSHATTSCPAHYSCTCVQSKSYKKFELNPNSEFCAAQQNFTSTIPVPYQTTTNNLAANSQSSDNTNYCSISSFVPSQNPYEQIGYRYIKNVSSASISAETTHLPLYNFTEAAMPSQEEQDIIDRSSFSGFGLAMTSSAATGSTSKSSVSNTLSAIASHSEYNKYANSFRQPVPYLGQTVITTAITATPIVTSYTADGRRHPYNPYPTGSLRSSISSTYDPSPQIPYHQMYQNASRVQSVSNQQITAPSASIHERKQLAPIQQSSWPVTTPTVAYPQVASQYNTLQFQRTATVAEQPPPQQQQYSYYSNHPATSKHAPHLYTTSCAGTTNRMPTPSLSTTAQQPYPLKWHGADNNNIVSNCEANLTPHQPRQFYQHGNGVYPQYSAGTHTTSVANIERNSRLAGNSFAARLNDAHATSSIPVVQTGTANSESTQKMMPPVRLNSAQQLASLTNPNTVETVPYSVQTLPPPNTSSVMQSKLTQRQQLRMAESNYVFRPPQQQHSHHHPHPYHRYNHDQLHSSSATAVHLQRKEDKSSQQQLTYVAPPPPSAVSNDASGINHDATNYLAVLNSTSVANAHTFALIGRLPPAYIDNSDKLDAHQRFARNTSLMQRICTAEDGALVSSSLKPILESRLQTLCCQSKQLNVHCQQLQQEAETETQQWQHKLADFTAKSNAFEHAWAASTPIISMQAHIDAKTVEYLLEYERQAGITPTDGGDKKTTEDDESIAAAEILLSIHKEATTYDRLNDSGFENGANVLVTSGDLKDEASGYNSNGGLSAPTSSDAKNTSPNNAGTVNPKSVLPDPSFARMPNAGARLSAGNY